MHNVRNHWALRPHHEGALNRVCPLLVFRPWLHLHSQVDFIFAQIDFTFMNPRINSNHLLP